MKWQNVTRDKSGPLYQRLAAELKKLIQENHHQGDPFLSEAQIEQRYNVSRITVRHALHMLELEGYIYRKPGKPTVVSRIKPVVDVGHRFGRLAEELRGMGLSVSASHFDFDVVAPPCEEFERMVIEFPYPGIFRFKHILFVDAKPISYAINYILEDPARIRLTAEDLEKRDFYEVLAADYNIDIINGDQSIGAVIADREMASIFKVKTGSPLLKTAVAGFNRKGMKKLYAVVYYDANLFQFRQMILH